MRKEGDAAALAHEARALRVLAGLPGVPEFLGGGPGVLEQSRLPGAPRPLAEVAPEDLARLGVLLRAVHDRAVGPVAGLVGWRRGERDPQRYARRRAREVAGTARAAGRHVRVPVPEVRAPYAFLHGDLTQDNVVWGPAGPGLVDWEFWHLGDPAEDLAYLWVLNGLGAPAVAAVARGYGDPDATARAETWRALIAVESAAWWARCGADERAEPLWAGLGDASL